MNPTQSNTQAGKIRRKAGSSDLTDKEGYLVKLAVFSGDGGSVSVPDNNADYTPFIIDEGADIGALVSIDPLSPDRQYRIKATGAGVTGDVLVLADTGGGDADRGKVRKLPAAAGTYYSVALAEENFADEQLVLCRPTSREKIVVP